MKVSPRKGLYRFGLKGKLSPKFIGPFKILRKYGKVAYKLALPPHLAGVHDVFHVSMLRKKEPDSHYIAEWNQFDLRHDVTYDEQPIQIMDQKI